MAYTTIDDPSAHFHIQLFTGDDNADRLITNDANAGDFRPDLLWLKNRSSVSSNCIFDSLRLASSESTVMLRTNNTNAEEDKVDRFGGFETDGFTVDGNDADTNADGDLFVAWQWKANGSGSSNTSGSINTTATSANTTSKFSISTYTGTGSNATIGHGLGVAPSFIWVKQRGGTTAQMVGHDKLSTGWTDYLTLHSTDPEYDDATMWQDTDPTSTVFSIGTDSTVNASSGTYVAYAFANVQGFSKFGSYTGNGNTDGAFVYTGLRPAWIMIKRTDTQDNWNIYDSKREGYNVDNDYVKANATTAEAADVDIDILSNGFKCRTADAAVNVSGATYVYATFAEAPFVNSNGVPCNAR